MIAGATILSLTMQVDFPDLFRLQRGNLVTYMGETDSLGQKRLLVLCPDGKVRTVREDEVTEN